MLLEEAEKAGAAFNNVMRSSHLLKSARLSKIDEQWVLQPCGGDLSQYQQIRAALRRLPWHSDSAQFQRTGEYYPTRVQAPTPFPLNNQSHLNQPENIVETPPAPNLLEGADIPDVNYADEESIDDDVDDDYFESD